MKKLTLSKTLLASSALALGFAASTYANHRTGDFPLPELIATGDFNQDGKIDLAINVAGFDNIAILQGDGAGGFTLKRHLETDTLPKGLAVADMNGDRHPDIISLCDWGYSLRINLGDGIGAFSMASESNGDGDPTRLVLGDVNNDGNLDTIANAPEEGNIIIYLGDGKGGLSNSPIEVEDLPKNFALTTGDFNNDGNLDLAATKLLNGGDTGSHVVILLGDGTGNFAESADFPVHPAPVSLKVGDMNNDGNADLVVAGAGPENNSGNYILLFLGDGKGGFTQKADLDLGTGSLLGEIALADFNEDGNLDVAFPVESFQTTTDSMTVLTFHGDGTGALTAGPVLIVGDEPNTVVALDFNKDGHIDLAVTNRTDATLSVLLGAGDGNFTTHAVIPLAVTPAP